MNLDTPIQYVKGVGPHYAKVLAKRGIHTIQELVEWFPRAYEDRRVARNIYSLQINEIVSLKAEIISIHMIPMGKSHRKIYDVVVRDATGTIHCKYFRTPFRGYFDRLSKGQIVRVVGKVVSYRGQKQFLHPDIKEVGIDEEVDKLVPIYTETEGVTPGKLHKVMLHALTGIKIPEKFPEWILKKYKLPTRLEALKHIHDPLNEATQEFSNLRSEYHKRIIFEEFFWLELVLAIKQQGIIRESACAIKQIPNYLEKVKSDLPFELTNAQKKTLEEIVNDLHLDHPMHRLVQGDVGSGKTIVSLLAANYVVKNGYQVALMVPTEILAEQHFANASRLGEKLGFKVGLLTGKMTAKEKTEICEKLKNKEIDVCIGTHALIQDDVEFNNLALVIIDEQHRFGVLQRKSLKSKGKSPHFLVMTATPIPRTLAMTVYGDLNVSIINELPKGRSPITTRVVWENKRNLVVGFIHEQVKKGRQAYVVYPLVEESEKIDLKDAVSSFEKWKVDLPGIKIGLLHGRMKSDEKDEIMNQFRRNEIQVLISTTVIEVGVDVPNATMMIIEHAERFGLSQLHQLRGRVGRGAHKSVCVLMLGKAVSQEARDRTNIMAETSDGFKIAEADLEFRGPGEFLGSKQSGLPGFKMAHLIRDMDILQEAREAAFDLIKKDPTLNSSENKMIKEELTRYQSHTQLATVG